MQTFCILIHTVWSTSLRLRSHLGRGSFEAFGVVDVCIRLCFIFVLPGVRRHSVILRNISTSAFLSRRQASSEKLRPPDIRCNSPFALRLSKYSVTGGNRRQVTVAHHISVTFTLTIVRAIGRYLATVNTTSSIYMKKNVWKLCDLHICIFLKIESKNMATERKSFVCVTMTLVNPLKPSGNCVYHVLLQYVMLCFVFLVLVRFSL